MRKKLSVRIHIDLTAANDAYELNRDAVITNQHRGKNALIYSSF